MSTTVCCRYSKDAEVVTALFQDIARSLPVRLTASGQVVPGCPTERDCAVGRCATVQQPQGNLLLRFDLTWLPAQSLFMRVPSLSREGELWPLATAFDGSSYPLHAAPRP
jgi:hypothetical protein